MEEKLKREIDQLRRMVEGGPVRRGSSESETVLRLVRVTEVVTHTSDPSADSVDVVKVVFIDGSYTDTTGLQSLSPTDRSATEFPAAYIPDSSFQPTVGDNAVAGRVNGQWYLLSLLAPAQDAGGSIPTGCNCRKCGTVNSDASLTGCSGGTLGTWIIRPLGIEMTFDSNGIWSSKTADDYGGASDFWTLDASGGLGPGQVTLSHGGVLIYWNTHRWRCVCENQMTPELSQLSAADRENVACQLCVGPVTDITCQECSPEESPVKWEFSVSTVMDGTCSNATGRNNINGDHVLVFDDSDYSNPKNNAGERKCKWWEAAPSYFTGYDQWVLFNQTNGSGIPSFVLEFVDIGSGNHCGTGFGKTLARYEIAQADWACAGPNTLSNVSSEAEWIGWPGVIEITATS